MKTPLAFLPKPSSAGMILASLAFISHPAIAAGPPDAVKDGARGVWTVNLPSEFQSKPSALEILLPDDLDSAKKYPVVYLLPVGSKRSGAYGEGMEEARKAGLANKMGAIIVEPLLDNSPWYGNHASDPANRQDDFMVKTLVPFMDSNYPTIAKPEGRWLVGFSKSGWGATTLLLRHPDVFGYAVAWDVPFMIDGTKPDWGPYGLKDNFGTKEAMLEVLPPTLVKQKGAALGTKPRLIIAPGKAWTPQVKAFRQILDEHRVPYIYRDDLRFEHRWDSGWLVPMMDELKKLASPPTES